MLREILRKLRPALVLLVALTFIAGGAYPVIVTGIAQGIFPREAGGSLVILDGQVVGSELVGQAFAGPGWFHGRPSATTPHPYNAASSGGSNLGPSNPDLAVDIVRRAAGSQSTAKVPGDLVTASGSGLDPHLSPASAMLQVERVARETELPPEMVRSLVESHIEPPQLGILGQARVNVLMLNLDLRTLLMLGAAEREHAE